MLEKVSPFFKFSLPYAVVEGHHGARLDVTPGEEPLLGALYHGDSDLDHPVLVGVGEQGLAGDTGEGGQLPDVLSASSLTSELWDLDAAIMFLDATNLCPHSPVKMSFSLLLILLGSYLTNIPLSKSPTKAVTLSG